MRTILLVKVQFPPCVNIRKITASPSYPFTTHSGKWISQWKNLRNNVFFSAMATLSLETYLFNCRHRLIPWSLTKSRPSSIGKWLGSFLGDMSLSRRTLFLASRINPSGGIRYSNKALCLRQTPSRDTGGVCKR
jgi:hypothetical protein